MAETVVAVKVSVGPSPSDKFLMLGTTVFKNLPQP